MEKVPTEYEEALVLVEYLRLKNHKFCHINNEVYTKSWVQKAKMMAQGTAKGFPDYLVIVNNRLIAVELKRTKNSTTSQEQKDWLTALNNALIPAIVAKGALQAIKFV